MAPFGVVIRLMALNQGDKVGTIDRFNSSNVESQNQRHVGDQ